MIRSVRRTQTFEALRATPRRSASSTLKIAATTVDALTEPWKIELAFAIGRHFGSAVERNRARRRLRAAFAEVAATGSIEPGAYLVVPKRRALSASYGELVDDVQRCLDRLSTHGAPAPATLTEA